MKILAKKKVGYENSNIDPSNCEISILLLKLLKYALHVPSMKLSNWTHCGTVFQG